MTLLRAEQQKDGKVKVVFGNTISTVITKQTYDIVETIIKAKAVENVDLTEKEAFEDDYTAGVNINDINMVQHFYERGLK